MGDGFSYINRMGSNIYEKTLGTLIWDDSEYGKDTTTDSAFGPVRLTNYMGADRQMDKAAVILEAYKTDPRITNIVFYLYSGVGKKQLYSELNRASRVFAVRDTSFRGRPFFPEEIRETLCASGSESLLVTTPTQIRACIRSNARLPQPELILSSAAPLDRKMAERAEKTYLTRVVEFYGSTETGAIAIRQPVVEQSWETFRGVRVTSVNNELEVRADYLPGPVLVQDQVDIIDSRHFLLLGRSADLIKIGGKRESLARLNQTLLAMDGVEDGAFFVPETIGDREPRLAAVVVAPGLSVKDILSHLSHSIDAVFLPRPLKIVDALPRTTTGKLTRKALLAMLK
ncbi:MAG: hypothetical protein DSZ33_00450 [Gammaproteobacteria bacterium]|nr:MAG: hypothetical protein DSZ33_00450 [Gammaproteobacteria bacterium]